MSGKNEGFNVLHYDSSDELTQIVSTLSDDHASFEVDSVSDYDEINDYFEENCVDAAVLSDEVPSNDFWDVLETVEQDYETPVVVYGDSVDLSEEIYDQAQDEALVDFVYKDDIGDDVLDFRHSLVQTTEYADKVNQIQELKERAQDIVSNLKHDMINPLGVAKGYANVLCNDLEVDVFFDIENNIVDKIERVEELVNDAEELAEGVNISEEDMERLDLNSIAEESLECLSIEDYQEGNNVENNLDVDIRELGKVKAHESRLKNLFTNLYCNSVDHSGQEIEDLQIRVGELSVFETSTRAPAEPKGIYIEDNGKGVPEKKRNEILKQGFSTSEDNTGYGLATVREIVEQHDWELKVKESQNGGARFEIEFRD